MLPFRVLQTLFLIIMVCPYPLGLGLLFADIYIPGEKIGSLHQYRQVSVLAIFRPTHRLNSPAVVAGSREVQAESTSAGDTRLARF